MKPARTPRSDKSAVKLLIVKNDELRDSSIKSLPDHLQAGDLLVVNDAATLPASFHGRSVSEQEVEVRLAAQLDIRLWRGVLFGAGDWRTPTENRAAAPALKKGDEIIFAKDFKARVIKKNDLSERLLDLEFDDAEDELWRKIYHYGKPVQYSYMNDELALWS
ncbi:MAG TPA: S-adenosylmethionine:tRNA ribosyltransferase-isomerase, partial [Blastocatellia bacterium]|nr:S-adenosylmethionine:tRNA ribosyltransferase-isomerase [Blastocatellia bacterium]